MSYTTDADADGTDTEPDDGDDGPAADRVEAGEDEVLVMKSANANNVYHTTYCRAVTRKDGAGVKPWRREIAESWGLSHCYYCRRRERRDGGP